jgi:hypothetical protein
MHVFVQADGGIPEAVFASMGADVQRWGTESENVNGILEKDTTRRTTLQHVKIYQSWQAVVHRDATPMAELPRDVLILRLQSFVLQVRKARADPSKPAERYARTSLICIFRSIQRWFVAQRFQKFRESGVFPCAPINIFVDEELGQFGDNLNSHLRIITKEGGAAVQHTPIITKADMARIYETVSEMSTRLSTLTSHEFNQWKYYTTAMNVPVRGHHGHANMTVGSFELGVDTNGKTAIIYDERKCAGKTLSGSFKEKMDRHVLHIYCDDKYPALCMHRMFEAEMSRRTPPVRDEDPWYLQCKTVSRTREEKGC